MSNEVQNSLAVQACRQPGASLHPTVRGTAIGIARVPSPVKDERFHDSTPDVAVLARILNGLRTMNVSNR